MAEKARKKQAQSLKNTIQTKAPAHRSVLSPEVLPLVSEGGSAFQNYMARISQIPLLSKEEEHKLAVHYFETQNPEAAKKLIQSNLRFVVKVAVEYSKFSSKLMDLIQEGNMGLIRAVREFNPYKGARLITYAVWWIRGYIQEHLMRYHSIVRLGAGKKQQKLFYLLQREKQALDTCPPSQLLPALARQSQNKVEEVEKMKELVLKKDFSLDQSINNEGKKSFLDIQADPSSSVDEELSMQQMSRLLKIHLKNMEKSLSEKERRIITGRLLKDPPQTLQEIADHFKVSREAIRQTENRLMKKLKEKLVPLLKKPY